MSSYLHNLIARTLNTMEVVKPRRQSLFEPIAQGPDGFFEEQIAVVERTPAPVEERVFKVAPHEPERLSIESRAMSQPPGPRVEPEPQPVRSKVAVAASDSPAKPAVSPDLTPHTTGFEDLKVPSVPERVLMTDRVVAPERITEHTVETVPLVETIHKTDGFERTIERIRRRDLVESHTLHDRTLVFEDEAPRLMVTRRPSAPQTLAGAVPPRPMVTVQTSQPAPQPPTIQVTIGRVEVRAPAPASGSTTKSKPPAGVKLEEYLRRRGGR
jgi:hypothetical protein